MNIQTSVYKIPSLTPETDLGTGTYTIQIEEKINDTESNFFSVIFLWHTNSTPLGNATADLICQGSEVIFNINNSLSGIGQNYRGSYYIIDFGDGEDPEIFTHAELLIDNSSADSSFEIPHNFQQPSCEIGDGTTDESSQYKVDFDMFNKFRKTRLMQTVMIMRVMVQELVNM